MSNIKFLFPYRLKNNKWLGTPDNFCQSIDYSTYIKLDVTKTNIVNEFDFNWLINHPSIIMYNTLLIKE